MELLDLFPTILDAAGASGAENREGRSLLPDLFGRQDTGKEFVFSEAYPMLRNRGRFGDWPHRMALAREWKLIQYGPDREDLFCLKDDPGETRNRAADPACAAMADKLRTALNERLGLLPRPEGRLLSGYYEHMAPQA